MLVKHIKSMVNELFVFFMQRLVTTPHNALSVRKRPFYVIPIAPILYTLYHTGRHPDDPQAGVFIAYWCYVSRLIHTLHIVSHRTPSQWSTSWSIHCLLVLCEPFDPYLTHCITQDAISMIHKLEYSLLIGVMWAVWIHTLHILSHRTPSRWSTSWSTRSALSGPSSTCSARRSSAAAWRWARRSPGRRTSTASRSMVSRKKWWSNW